jgi:hypothetical protein
MIRGAVLGQIAVAIVGSRCAQCCHGLAPAQLFRHLERVATRMLMVYVPLRHLIIRDVFRSRHTVRRYTQHHERVSLGPFTLIRPLVVLAGAHLGLLAAPTPAVLFLIVLMSRSCWA